MDPAYYPFLYFAILSFLMELIVRFLTIRDMVTAHVLSLHIYSFIECYLFTWLFHNWGLFDRRRNVFIGILATFFVLWLVSSLLLHGIKEPNFYFLIIYSFALIFFSVNMFNKAVVHERGNILRNPKFLICLGIIIFYTFFIMVCVTNLSVVKQSVSRLFRANLQEINVYSNLLVNFLYAVAMLWIPRKQNFTTPFSL